MIEQLKLPPHLKSQSTKTYTHDRGLSVCFRQWRAESHCHFLHGYSLQIRLTFSSRVLDHRNWVVDFGSLKSLKGWLEDLLDHKTLIAEDDPHIDTFQKLAQDGIIDLRIVPHVGIEALSYYVFEYAEQWLIDSGYAYARLEEVEVWEHAANSAKCVRS